MTEQPKLNHFGLIPLEQHPDFIPIGANGEVDWQRVWAVVPKQHMIDVLVEWAEERMQDKARKEQKAG